jgi:phosphotransferase family enzyme
VPVPPPPVEDRWTTAEEALLPLATPPQWLAVLADPAYVAAAIGRRVPELARCELTLTSRQANQAWIKKKSLGTFFRLEVPRGNGRSARVVYLRARLVPPGWPEPEAASGGTLSDSAWRCWLPELRLDLTIDPPDDQALPALAWFRDGRSARALLEQGIRTGSPHYRDLRIEACSAHVARYNRGSRCTILFRLRFPPGSPSGRWPETVVAKVHHGRKGRSAYEGMRALWASELRDSPNVTIAEPLAHLPESSVLIQAGIPHERTLEALLRHSLRAPTPETADVLVSYLVKTARGLAEFHACRARLSPAVTWEYELAEVRLLLLRLSAVFPGLTGTAAALLVRLEALARAHPPDPLRPAHRSFRPAQVVLNKDAIGFIDFDGVCRAEPAMDVALFRATMRDIGLRALGDESPNLKAANREAGQVRPEQLAQLDELCEAFSLAYEEIAPVSRARIALWEALHLLTLVLHSWTKVRFDRLGYRMALLQHHLRASELDG